MRIGERHVKYASFASNLEFDLLFPHLHSAFKFSALTEFFNLELENQVQWQ